MVSPQHPGWHRLAAARATSLSARPLNGTAKSYRIRAYEQILAMPAAALSAGRPAAAARLRRASRSHQSTACSTQSQRPSMNPSLASPYPTQASPSSARVVGHLTIARRTPSHVTSGRTHSVRARASCPRSGCVRKPAIVPLSSPCPSWPLDRDEPRGISTGRWPLDRDEPRGTREHEEARRRWRCQQDVGLGAGRPLAQT